jgi:hypothetical protein
LITRGDLLSEAVADEASPPPLRLSGTGGTGSDIRSTSDATAFRSDEADTGNEEAADEAEDEAGRLLSGVFARRFRPLTRAQPSDATAFRSEGADTEAPAEPEDEATRFDFGVFGRRSEAALVPLLLPPPARSRSRRADACRTCGSLAALFARLLLPLLRPTATAARTDVAMKGASEETDPISHAAERCVCCNSVVMLRLSSLLPPR